MCCFFSYENSDQLFHTMKWKINNQARFYCKFSELLDRKPTKKTLTPRSSLVGTDWNTLAIPNVRFPPLTGQDLDFVNVVCSHLVHSDWSKLNPLASGLSPLRVKHILLRFHKDDVISLELFKWAAHHNPKIQTLCTSSMMMHILAKNHKFKSAESILRNVLGLKMTDLTSKLVEEILHSYRMCDSSPRVFDLLFKTYALSKKLRNATDTFFLMKAYGFLPTLKSCNAFMSILLELHRTDILLSFYREMRLNCISPNIYTINMVLSALCKSGKVGKATEILQDMPSMGLKPTITSYNTLISGYFNQGHVTSAMNLKYMATKQGVELDVVTYNTLMYGLCKNGRIKEANKLFSQMKREGLSPNTVTYNVFISSYGSLGNSEMCSRFFQEMTLAGVETNILTYNGLIWGLCKEGKTKNAGNLVKQLIKKNLVPNSSTFSALIFGQCVRKFSERAFEIFKCMMKSRLCPNAEIFKIMISTFCRNEDLDGAVTLFEEMVKRRIAPDSEVLFEICTGLCKYGKPEITEQLVLELAVPSNK